ncbi:MAG: glycyl-radical enzyme activating protein [Bacteroidales bacterium]|nr:glycyl-radical enzyme activating protein [Bacteroidales bacterium]
MKAIIFDIRSFSVHDGPGIRTSFFFKGCPLRCTWCHNPESHSAEIEFVCATKKMERHSLRETVPIGESVSIETAIARVKADRLFFEDSGGGITLSGGEPLMQHQFAKELLMAANALDIHTAIDTCGFATEKIFQETVAYAKLVLYDLKIINSALHKKFTGQDNQLILNNFKWLQQQNKAMIIRIPLIENITDTPENFEAIHTLLSSSKNIQRIDLLPFHASANQKYLKLNKVYHHANSPSYPAEKSEKALDFFHSLAPIVSIGA